MVLAERAKAWRIALIATVASVVGGFAGYIIGAFLFDQVARPLLDVYGYGAKFDEFAALYNDWGVWIVLFAGLTPFPYKVITIASGATGLNILVFALASVVARGARFFIVAALLYWVGPPVRAFIEGRLGLVFTAFMVLLVGGFVAARYLI
jgi:membrane protein YqaA with SNARE-associated domain